MASESFLVWVEDMAIPQWVRWCKTRVGAELGHRKITPEGRLRDGELPGIHGAGAKRSPSNPVAEAVEKAVVEINSEDPVMAFIFRKYHVRRLSYRKIAVLLRKKMGVSKSHTSISTTEKAAMRRIVESMSEQV